MKSKNVLDSCEKRTLNELFASTKYRIMGQDFYFRETGKTLLNNLALQDHIIQTTLKKNN